MSNIQTETKKNDFNIRDSLLIALTFSSGAVDAISYFGLGKIFSAFMTGNLVFLGFGLANAGGPVFLPVILALCVFAAGAYLGTRITLPATQDSGLWPWRVSAALGLAAIAEAGFLGVWMATAGQTSSGIANVLIVLFALAMGLQTAAVRSLGVQGVFTTAATFTLVAFAGDFAGSRPKAEVLRLAGVLLGLIAGATAGGLLFVYVHSYAPVLPLVITILVILTGVSVLRKHHETGTLTARRAPVVPR
jgi:uncharacterized membrane protein YoaK (UPF0700 family)